MGNVRKVRVQVIDLQINADGSGALITKQSKDNPSPNGVHKLRVGQIARLSQRALGVANPIALKHVIKMSAGSTFLVLDCEDVKEGEVFTKTNPDGTTSEDKYKKDWTKTSNEELELGAVATQKIAEISLNAMFATPIMYAPAPSARNREEVHADDQSGTGDAGGEKQIPA